MVGLAAVLGAACGDPTATPTTTGEAVGLPVPTELRPSAPDDDPSLPSIARCDDIEPITTDVLSDGTSAGMIDPILHGVLLTYAAEHADAFGGLWIDRDAFGTIVLAFTDDPDEHRAAVADLRPSVDDIHAMDPPPEITDDRPIGEWGVPFDVVQVAHTEAELVDAIAPVLAAVESATATPPSGGVDVRRNRITIELPTPVTAHDLAGLTVEIAAVDGLSTDMVCWSGQFVDEAPSPISPGTPLDVIVLPGADGSYPADTPVTCDGIRFELGALADLTPAADVDPDLRSVLDGWLANPEGQLWPQDGWFLLHEDGERATFIHLGDGGVSSIGAEMGTNGWIWSGAGGGGDCDVRRLLPAGMGAVDWELDPAFPAPDETSTELRVLVTEAGCAGGREMGDSLLGPQVVETDEAVRIAFAVIPLAGAQTCPGNPATPVTIRLDAPLGEREIRDGLVVGPLTALLPH